MVLQPIFANSMTPSYRTDLIFSKTRVAPLKPLTIPRLELMAAYLGANVISFLRQELPFTMSSTLLWSDSTTALQWLDSNKKLPPFVHNRVSSIRNVPDVEYNYFICSDLRVQRTCWTYAFHWSYGVVLFLYTSHIRYLLVQHSMLVNSQGIKNGNILLPLDILHPLDKSQQQSTNYHLIVTHQLASQSC